MGPLLDRVKKRIAARDAMQSQQEHGPPAVPPINPQVVHPATAQETSTQRTASPSIAAVAQRSQEVGRSPSQRPVRKWETIVEELLSKKNSPPSSEPAALEAGAPVVPAEPPRPTQAELFQAAQIRMRKNALASGGSIHRTTSYSTRTIAVTTVAAVGSSAGQKSPLLAQKRKRKEGISDTGEIPHGKKVKDNTKSAPLLDSELDSEEDLGDEDDDLLEEEEGSRRHRRQKPQRRRQERTKMAKKQRVSPNKKATKSTTVPFLLDILATQIDDEGNQEKQQQQQQQQAEAALLLNAPPEYRIRLDENGNELPPLVQKNPSSSQDKEDEQEEEEDDAYLNLAVPGSIAKYLRPYQQDGIKFLLQNYARGRGCLLADDMGLGKTLQTIAFLSAVLGKTGNPRIDINYPELPRLERFSQSILDDSYIESRGSGSGSDDGGDGLDLTDDDIFAPDYSTNVPILIVCPTSLLDNWMAEFKTWGTFRATKLTSKNMDTGLNSLLKGNLEIGITSFDSVRNSIHKFSVIPWHIVVFDEAHKLKNPKAGVSQAAARLPTRLRFALSGTPMANDYKELFNLMNLVVPGSMGNGYKQFKEDYEEKIKHGMRKDAREDQIEDGLEAQDALQRLLRPLMLRRTKSIIAHQLPKKKDNIVFCQLAPLQLKAYKRALQLPDVQLLLLRARDPCPCGSGEKIYKCHSEACPGYYKLTYEQGGVLYPHFHYCECDNDYDAISNPEGCKNHKPNGCMRPYKGRPMRMCPFCLLMPLMTILRKISLHLDLVKAKPEDEKTSLIKFEWDKEVADAVFGTDVEVLGGNVQSSRHLEMVNDISLSCGKLAALKGLLTKWAADVRGSGGLPHKVLIFSNSVRMLKIVRKMADAAGWVHLYLTGETPQQDRQPLVDSFNAPDSTAFLFIVSTGAGGVGLNLTGANKVVILDPSYSPAADLQAMDRAFRIGQKRDVDVYRLVAAGTIEERIYMRQISKQQHSNVAVDGAGAQQRLFTGVKGNKFHKGDLWGFENMLGSLLKDEVDRVEAMDIVQGARGAGGDGGSGSGSTGGNSNGELFTIEEVPEEVIAELEETAAAAATVAATEEGGGGGDFEDGFDPGLEAVLLQEEEAEEVGGEEEEEGEAVDAAIVEVLHHQRNRKQVQKQNQQEIERHGNGKGEDKNKDGGKHDDDDALNIPGVLGIVAHDIAIAPSKDEHARRKAVKETAKKKEEGKLAVASTAEAAEPVSLALESLAAWKQISVGELAKKIVEMSKKERKDLIDAYCEFTAAH